MWLSALLFPAFAVAALSSRDQPATYIRNIELPIMNGLVWSTHTVPHTEPDAFWRISGVDALAAPGSGEVVTTASRAYFDNSGVSAAKNPRLLFTYPRGSMYLRGSVTGVADGAALGVIEFYANGERTEIPISYNQTLQDRGHVLEVLDSQMTGAASAAFILDATFQGTIQVTHFGYNTSVPGSIPEDRDFVVAERISFVDGDVLSSDSRIDHRGASYAVTKLKASQGSDMVAFLQGTPQNSAESANVSVPTIALTIPTNTSAIQFNGGLGNTAAPKTIQLIANGEGGEKLDSWSLQGGMDNNTLGSGMQLFATLDPNAAYTAVISMEDGVLLGSIDLFTMSQVTRPKAPAAGDAANHGLSSGAIAGIVVGVVAGLIVIGLIVFFLRHKRKNRTPVSPTDSTTRLQGFPRQNSEFHPVPFASAASLEVLQTEKSRSPPPGRHTAPGPSKSDFPARPIGNPVHAAPFQNHTGGFTSPGSTSRSTSVCGDGEVFTKSSVLSHESSAAPSRILTPTPSSSHPALPSEDIHIEEDAGHLQTLPMRILPPNYNPKWEREHLHRASETGTVW